jgi:CRP-like cAMP-binding protein
MFELLMDVLDTFRNNLVNSQYLVQGTAYSKVASILVSLANNYGTKKGDKVTINFATTHRVLASLTGIARETTSLQILKLKDKGIIQTKGSHFVINDIEELKKETEV